MVCFGVVFDQNDMCFLIKTTSFWSIKVKKKKVSNDMLSDIVLSSPIFTLKKVVCRATFRCNLMLHLFSKRDKRHIILTS